jgi:beta-lactamase class A
MKKIAAALGLCLGLSAQAAPQQQKIDVLWDHFAAEVADTEKGLDGVLGVAMLDITSGRTFLLHPDEVFPQASSIKITVLAELYHQAEQGKLKLTDPYVVQASDIVQDSDIMGGLTPGVTTRPPMC